MEITSMNFLSVASGIEASSVAWMPLGWRAWAFSEIDKFPCALLAHHYSATPNFGDMTGYKDWPDAAIDLLCGGTPCQSFSNAGLRAGLDDPRGQLMLTFGAIAARYRPRWLVWENVPGVLSSNSGRDFGTFLGLLGFLGYGFAYRILDAQYVRVDGHGRAVPQRRNRVFVVGCLGDWRSAAAVLLERESLRGDSAPRRETGTGAACGTLAGTGTGSGWRVGADEAAAGQLVAHTLKAEGFDANEDGTGRGVPLIAAFGGNRTSGERDVASALSAHGGTGRHDFETETFIAHAFDARQSDVIQYGDKAGPLDTDGSLQAICLNPTQITSGENRSNPQPGGPCHTLAKGMHAPAIASRSAVRRLTPTECEALQGFPRGYTAVPYRGKPAADAPRYKALGNSWAVNCARWIGRRIALAESIAAVEPSP
jgi:DNA (cytosine-5)-methyltransferase 1